MYCEKCGIRVEGNKYCSKCGHYAIVDKKSQGLNNENIYVIMSGSIIMIPMVIATLFYGLAYTIGALDNGGPDKTLILLATLFVILSILIFIIIIVKGFFIRESDQKSSKAMIFTALITIFVGPMVMVMFYGFVWAFFETILN